MAQDQQQKPKNTPQQQPQQTQQQPQTQQQQDAQRPAGTAPHLATYVVDAGETLWDIADNAYGDGNYWIELWNANRAKVPNAHSLQPGTVLVLPIVQGKPQQTQSHEAPAAVVAAGAKSHTVTAGETLAAIAKNELGSAARWTEIWDLNRAALPNPNRVKIGQVLVLPQATAPQVKKDAKPGPQGEKAPTEPKPTTPGTTPPQANPTQPLTPDGKKAVGKTPNERVAAKLYNEKGPLIAAEAARIGIEPGVAAACMLVETRGQGQTGQKMTIRFEPHIFKKYTSKLVEDTHDNQAAEWASFEAAKAIDADAAFKSISMGTAQVMGFNAERLGYKTAEEMFNALNGSDEAQSKGFFEFVRTSKALLDAAKTRDWPEFARIYNGPNYKDNAYDTKMASYYDAWQTVTAGLKA